MKATTDTVRIYSGDRLIAEHKRAVRKWQRSTQQEHVPGQGTNLHGAYSAEELMYYILAYGIAYDAVVYFLQVFCFHQTLA